MTNVRALTSLLAQGNVCGMAYGLPLCVLPFFPKAAASEG